MIVIGFVRVFRTKSDHDHERAGEHRPNESRERVPKNHPLSEAEETRPQTEREPKGVGDRPCPPLETPDHRPTRAKSGPGPCPVYSKGNGITRRTRAKDQTGR